MRPRGPTNKMTRDIGWRDGLGSLECHPGHACTPSYTEPRRMNLAGSSPFSTRPAPWKLLLALTLVYLSWGTTYLAIRAGVQTLPPGLFGGVLVFLAGLVLLGFLALRGGMIL